jgi:iron-sulfur cluster assembly accessory protein
VEIQSANFFGGKCFEMRGMHIPRGGRAEARPLRPSLTCRVRAIVFLAMIEVTENAVRQLRVLLQEQKAAVQKGLRVQIAKGGCSGLQYEMLLDEKRNGDAVVERDGMEFFVDAESAPMLKGSTLDYHDGLTGTGFRIVNPNATRTCGCGTSFEAAPSA